MMANSARFSMANSPDYSSKPHLARGLVPAREGTSRIQGFELGGGHDLFGAVDVLVACDYYGHGICQLENWLFLWDLLGITGDKWDYIELYLIISVGFTS